MERDGGRCTTPGCSRVSAQNHHVVHRSQGGGDDPGNLTAVCAPHHLRGIHGGLIRVSGTAPDSLVWELRSGVRLGRLACVGRWPRAREGTSARDPSIVPR